LQEWRDTSLKILKEFDQNQGMHAIFVSKKMLEDDPKFEQSLLEKARKQQDLVIMSYDLTNKTSEVLYKPKTSYKIDRIEITFVNHQCLNLDVDQISVIKKQQDLVVMSYDSKGTTKVLYEPKTSYISLSDVTNLLLSSK
jgi:hypothetical protein